MNHSHLWTSRRPALAGKRQTINEESRDDRHCDALLRSLGFELGLGEVVFDAERSCLLKFDDVLLNLQSLQGPWLFLTATLFLLRPPVQADYLAHLLRANLYGKETAAAALAYDAQTGAVFLQDRLRKQGLELPFLLDRITVLTDAVERWRDRMPRDQAIALEPDAPPSPHSPHSL